MARAASSESSSAMSDAKRRSEGQAGCIEVQPAPFESSQLAFRSFSRAMAFGQVCSKGALPQKAR